MAEGLTKAKQKSIRKAIKLNGMTVHGWARKHAFPLDTVKNVLYKSWGIGEVGPKAAEVIEALTKDGFVKAKTKA